METTCEIRPVSFDFELEIVKKAVAEKGFHVVGYAATTDFDLQGDMIAPEALKASTGDLIKNSTVLLNHDDKRAIGKVTKVTFDKNGLLIDVLISKTEADVVQKIKEGILNKFSIRGRVLEKAKEYIHDLGRVVNVIKRMALVEASLVSVPANPEAKAISWYISKALQEAGMEGTEIYTEDEIKKNEEEKAAAEKAAAEKAAAEKAAAEKAAAEKAAAEKAAAEKAAADKAAAEKADDESDDEPTTKELDAVKAQHPKFAKIFDWLDQLIKMGGEVAPIAQKIKANLTRILGPTQAYPSPTSKDFKDLVATLVTGEVKKQLDEPAERKGRASSTKPDLTMDELVKEIAKLDPEDQIKLALGAASR